MEKSMKRVSLKISAEYCFENTPESVYWKEHSGKMKRK